MKVLIGVDGSAGSLAAVSLAGRLVAAGRDEVGFFYAPPKVTIRGDIEQPPEILQRLGDELSKAVFQKAREQLPDSLSGDVHTLLDQQPARQGLLAAADRWGADVIAVGARGLGPLAKLVLGSVAISAAHAASVPVLVVRPAPPERPAERLNVLLASDGSQASRRAGAALGKFRWPAGTAGRVITVIEPMAIGPVPHWIEQQVRDQQAEAMAQAWAQEHEENKRAKGQELAAQCQQLPEPFRQSEPIVAEGHPAEQILKAISDYQIDLVVVGAHGKSMWQRFTMGSTSEAILAHAPCSVLLVRQREPP